MPYLLCLLINSSLRCHTLTELLSVLLSQSEGSGMWISGPGREMSGLPSNSFYLPPPLAITPPQSGHGGGAYGGIYHPAQPNVHPLVQQSQTMAPSVETVRPPIGAYHQHSLSSQVNWNTTY